MTLVGWVSDGFPIVRYGFSDPYDPTVQLKL